MTNNSKLPDSLHNLLKQYYNFDEIINLELFDYNLNSLKQTLTKLKKDFFEPTDRIIFFNREPGFFIRQRDQVVWYNLQKILSDLDISNRFCIVITQHDNRQYFNEIYKDISTDDFPIEVFDYWQFTDWMPIPNHNIELNFDLIEKHYITLNRIRRKHRSLTVAYLEHYNILDRGLVSYNAIKEAEIFPEYKDATAITQDPTKCHQYIMPVPYTTVNEDWFVRDVAAKRILENLVSRGSTWVYKNFHEDNTSNYRHNVASNSDLLQRAFLWIATESEANCPVSFLSEKSAKSFYAKRPFVVVSGPNTLKRIQSFGFKTFSDYWDESYDSELDVTRRIQKVMKIVNDVAQLSHSELIALANSMTDVLEYNYQHLLNFEQYQLNQIEQQIHRNLNTKNDSN